MAYSEKKRFVAGAVCPRCEQMDKLVVYSRDGKDYRECVACDYHEEMRFSAPARELQTRVSPTSSVEERTIHIIDPSLTQLH